MSQQGLSAATIQNSKAQLSLLTTFSNEGGQEMKTIFLNQLLEKLS
jgi:hypothetical protein